MTDLEFLTHISECVRIKNRLNRIRDFTGQDLLASFKKLELKQLLSTIMKIKFYPDLSNQNSRFDSAIFFLKVLILDQCQK